MGAAVSANPPSVPVQLHDPNTRVAEPPHSEAPGRRINSFHRDLDISGIIEPSLCEELSKRREEIPKNHPQCDGQSRVAALRQAIEVKDKDRKIIELKEQVERLRTLSDNSKVMAEVLEGKDAELQALKDEVQQLEKAQCKLCKENAKVEKELGRVSQAQNSSDGDTVKDAEITALEDQVQQLQMPCNKDSDSSADDNDELKAHRVELDRLRKTEKNSKVPVDLLERAAKEVVFLRDEVVALRKRLATFPTADSYLMVEEEVLSLRAEVMRLRQMEKNSHAAAEMLEEIVGRSDAAADVLCKMMSRRPEVPEKGYCRWIALKPCNGWDFFYSIAKRCKTTAEHRGSPVRVSLMPVKSDRRETEDVHEAWNDQCLCIISFVYILICCPNPDKSGIHTGQNVVQKFKPLL